MEGGIKLRPAGDADRELLFAVYASTRAAEVALFGWEEAQQDAFLRMQFTGREAAYRMQYPTAEQSVIELGGVGAGSVMIDRRAGEIVLTDIAVLPEYRGKGIATAVIKDLMNEAADAGLPVVLRVDKMNGYAHSLYQGLGFQVVAEDSVRWSMEWRAGR